MKITVELSLDEAVYLVESQPALIKQRPERIKQEPTPEVDELETVSVDENFIHETSFAFREQKRVCEQCGKNFDCKTGEKRKICRVCSKENRSKAMREVWDQKKRNGAR